MCVCCVRVRVRDWYGSGVETRGGNGVYSVSERECVCVYRVRERECVCVCVCVSE